MRVLCVTEISDRPETELFVELKRMGVEIDVMCSPRSPYYRYLIESGVPVTGLEVKSRVDRSAIGSIRRQLKAGSHDILHGFNNKIISCSLWAAAGLGIKIVAYRGIVGNVSFFDPGSWMTYLHPRIDRVICVAEAVRQYFLDMRWAGLRLKPEKFVTIYKGHRLEWYPPQPVDLGQFGIPPGAFVIGCTANYRPRKGIEVLIDAAGHLPQQPPVHLLLVGDMTSKRLQGKIESSPLRNAIHLTGYRSDAPALTAACDVYVLPALRREGLPKGVIEAMCHGVPPIVTDSGGSPELVEHGISGLVVPPGNAAALAEALSELMADPGARRRMGKQAQKCIAERFRHADTVENTFQLYSALAGEPSGKRG